MDVLVVITAHFPRTRVRSLAIIVGIGTHPEETPPCDERLRSVSRGRRVNI
jgi:hypothetical protein